MKWKWERKYFLIVCEKNNYFIVFGILKIWNDNDEENIFWLFGWGERGKKIIK